MIWQHGSSWIALTSMSLAMVALLALVILAVVAVVRTLQPRDEHAPEHVLAERLARGDIDEKEYRQRLHAVASTERLGRS